LLIISSLNLAAGVAADGVARNSVTPEVAVVLELAAVPDLAAVVEMAAVVRVLAANRAAPVVLRLGQRLGQNLVVILMPVIVRAGQVMN
jgi:predicted nicotinamide N-methyase